MTGSGERVSHWQWAVVIAASSAGCNSCYAKFEHLRCRRLIKTPCACDIVLFREQECDYPWTRANSFYCSLLLVLRVYFLYYFYSIRQVRYRPYLSTQACSCISLRVPLRRTRYMIAIDRVTAYFISWKFNIQQFPDTCFSLNRPTVAE